MLPAEFEDGLRGAPSGCGIATEYLEHGLEEVGVGLGRDVIGFDRARDSLFDQLPCPSDLAELPYCMGEVGRRDNSKLHAEIELGIVT